MIHRKFIDNLSIDLHRRAESQPQSCVVEFCSCN